MTPRYKSRAIALVAACALGATLSACSKDSDEQPTPSSTLEPAPSGTSAPNNAASDNGGGQSLDNCNVPGEDNTIPKAAPKVDEWADIAGVGVPTSKTFGPLVKEGNLWQCYQHSPTGALFAAAYLNIAAEGVPDVWEHWVTESELKSIGDDASADPSALSGVRIVGYQFESATPDKVVVNIAIQTNDNGAPAYAGIKTGLIWKDGRWQREVSQSSSGATQLTEDLPGYTRWSING